MPNAGDEAQVKKAGEREKYEHDIALLDLRWIMADKRGRRVINRIIEFSGPLKECFNPNGSMTNYNLGRASLGRKLFAELDEACPELFLLMRQESRNSKE